MIELVEPKNKETLIFLIKKLIKYQNKARIMNNIFKNLIKYLNAQETTTSYVIY